MNPTLSPHRRHWQLRNDLRFLNHGSFGATPTRVLQVQRAFQDELERDPIEFLAHERELESKLDHVRSRIASLVNADESDLAFVGCATEGLNCVVQSMKLNAGDEILMTDHGYNACNNAIRYCCDRWGATPRTASIPFPIADQQEVIDSVVSQFTSATRLLVIDHVTSPTALVLPIREIIRAAHEHGIRVFVDGAHAPGMLPLNLTDLDADYYTGNHHKWLCAPKASAFLWVKSDHQHEVRPSIISHGANRPRPNRSRFQSEFDWRGTFDPTPILALPASIDFLSGLLPDDQVEVAPEGNVHKDSSGLERLMASNHRMVLEARGLLLDALGVSQPAPDDMIGSMVTIPIPETCRPPNDWQAVGEPDNDAFQSWLYHEHQIEVPIFPGLTPGTRFLRISCQIYNAIDEYKALADALGTRNG